MRPLAIALTLLLTGISPAADPITAPVTVAGRLDHKDLTYKDAQETVAKGLVLAVFGSSTIETDASKERWEAAAKTDHVRIRFDPPTKIATAVHHPGTTYSVDEILVKTTPWAQRAPLPTPNGQGYFAAGEDAQVGKGDDLLIRSGDKYYSFSKFQGVLIEPVILLFGPSSKPKE